VRAHDDDTVDAFFVFRIDTQTFDLPQRDDGRGSIERRRRVVRGSIAGRVNHQTPTVRSVGQSRVLPVYATMTSTGDDQVVSARWINALCVRRVSLDQ
jgi:hypothetical protein